MKPRRIKAKVGDVFQIPVDKTRVGYSQIVAKIEPNPFYMVVYEPLFHWDDTPFLKDLINSEILFLANSFDAKIWYGHWPIVGNCSPDLHRIPFPSFKTTIRNADEYYVISYDGLRRRKATPEECDLLDFRTNIAPIRLENALKAYYDVIPWEEDFEKLTFKYVKARSKIVV